MPNYTKNHLIVRGNVRSLKYFYERNRVSEEDSYYMNGGTMEGNQEVRPLSFNKCVPREIQGIIEKYISENYTINSELINSELQRILKESICWNLIVSIWGTKWDAIDSIVDLSEIDDNEDNNMLAKITYTFATAWCYPHNWLITISKIFHDLTFEIISSDEDDAYAMVSVTEFKKGNVISNKSYNALEKSMENYTIPQIIDLIIEYFTTQNIHISDYDEKSKITSNIHWLTYCKSYLEKDGDDDDLFLDIMCQMHDLIDEHKFHDAIYTHKELRKAFADRIRILP